MTSDGSPLSQPGRKTNINAFETLKLPGLSSTAELRKVNEHARVRQAMGGSEQPDDASEMVERLLGDPVYRVGQAAAWYFAFGTADSAAASDGGGQDLHDKVVLQWRRVLEGATGGAYDPDQFDEACESTTELLNNPMVWQPLDQLVREIGDPRVGSGAVPSAATDAAESWISETLFALAAAGSHEFARDASDAVVAEGLPDDVVDAVTLSVLRRAADELGSAATDAETLVGPLIEQIPDDPSLASALRAAAHDLAAAARPWWALVDVFDEDPDSGAEGHALDRVARLLRGAAVALFNHTDDGDAAERLLGFACEIGQSASLRASLEEDHRIVRYRIAVATVIAAIDAGDAGRAKALSLRVSRYASSAEERAEAAQVEAVVARMRGPARAPARAAAGSSGCGSIVGVIVALFVVGSIIAAVVSSIGGSSDSSSGASGSRNDPAPAGRTSAPGGRTVQPQGGVGSLESERLAIERERSRLDDVEAEIEDLGAQIDSLSQQLDSTLAQYPNGAPSYVVSQYEADRRRFNAMVDDYNDMFADYETDLDEFNRRVDDYNRR